MTRHGMPWAAVATSLCTADGIIIYFGTPQKKLTNTITQSSRWRTRRHERFRASSLRHRVARHDPGRISHELGVQRQKKSLPRGRVVTHHGGCCAHVDQPNESTAAGRGRHGGGLAPVGVPREDVLDAPRRVFRGHRPLYRGYESISQRQKNQGPERKRDQRGGPLFRSARRKKRNEDKKDTPREWVYNGIIDKVDCHPLPCPLLEICRPLAIQNVWRKTPYNLYGRGPKSRC